MQAKGYWYYNKQIFEVTTSKHIDWIIKYPEKFGLTEQDIKSIYDKHNEKIGFEGKAREELIRMAISKGWIRIRHYVRPHDYWSIQYSDYRRQKKAIRDCIENLILDMGEMTNDDEVILMGLDDGSRFDYSFVNGGIGEFLKENNKKPKYKLYLVEDFNSIKGVI